MSEDKNLGNSELNAADELTNAPQSFLEPADSIELLPNHRPPDYPC